MGWVNTNYSYLINERSLEYLFKISSLNFWDKAWWFLSLRVFGLLSSSLLFPQCFGRYVLRPSSGVCRTREPSRNFELRHLLNPQGSPVLIPLAITGSSVKYSCIVTRLQSGLNRQPPDDSHLRSLGNQCLWPLRYVSYWRTYWPKRCGNNNEDEDNSLKTINDKKII